MKGVLQPENKVIWLTTNSLFNSDFKFRPSAFRSTVFFLWDPE